MGHTVEYGPLKWPITACILTKRYNKYYLLTESEVITGKSQTKAGVSDFPVMTERMGLISYLLYGLFSAILKKNTIKTTEIIFHIHLRALWLSSSLMLKKWLYVSVVLCPFFLLFSPTYLWLYSQLKRAVELRKIFIMPCHYKKIMPAQQPIRVCVLLWPCNK